LRVAGYGLRVAGYGLRVTLICLRRFPKGISYLLELRSGRSFLRFQALTNYLMKAGIPFDVGDKIRNPQSANLATYYPLDGRSTLDTHRTP
jgi:hypothetical protein